MFYTFNIVKNENNTCSDSCSFKTCISLFTDTIFFSTILISCSILEDVTDDIDIELPLLL